MALVAIASLLLLLGSFAVWAKRQLIETDTWTDTSTEMNENPAIQNALADYLVVEHFDNVDAEAQLAAKLQPQHKPLAGPISGGLRQLADQVATKALAQPQVQDALGGGEPRERTSSSSPIIDDETDGGLDRGRHGHARARQRSSNSIVDPARDRRRRGLEAAARRGVSWRSCSRTSSRRRRRSVSVAAHTRRGCWPRSRPDPLRARDLPRRQPPPRDPARRRDSASSSSAP